ncbi:hypothetical protein J7E29_09875 [Streptomyces sp. ISL-90]|nr:hypothetical protein [Streptomyces sp. ISL-90]
MSSAPSDRSFVATWMFYEQHRLIAWIITAASVGLWLLTSAISRAFFWVPPEYVPMMPWWQGR